MSEAILFRIQNVVVRAPICLLLQSYLSLPPTHKPYKGRRSRRQDLFGNHKYLFLSFVSSWPSCARRSEKENENLTDWYA